MVQPLRSDFTPVSTGLLDTTRDTNNDAKNLSRIELTVVCFFFTPPIHAVEFERESQKFNYDFFILTRERNEWP